LPEGLQTVPDLQKVHGESGKLKIGSDGKWSRKTKLLPKGTGGKRPRVVGDEGRARLCPVDGRKRKYST